jgi:transcriptional regulator with XRE-family HTH domain
MRIKDVLKEKGITQPELAAKMGVSLSAVKQMVRADSLTTATLEKIAGAVDVPMWQLIVSPADVMPVAGVTISCPHCGKPLKITGI